MGHLGKWVSAKGQNAPVSEAISKTKPRSSSPRKEFGLCFKNTGCMSFQVHTVSKVRAVGALGETSFVWCLLL